MGILQRPPFTAAEAGAPFPLAPARRGALLHALDAGRFWGLNAALACIWLWFAFVHLQRWLGSGDPRGIGAVAIETVVAVLFLVRRRPRETSLHPLAWLATLMGAFGPMFMRPTDAGGSDVALVMQLAGAAFAFASLLTLGRSFGLVAANRGVVRRGPYRLVRHPAYLGYLVVHIGYVLENPSARNAAIFAAATAGQLVRIAFEERVLSRDAEYAAYKQRVRHRLLPYVF